MSKKTLEQFLESLHPNTTVLSKGKAEVMGRVMDAVLLRSLPGNGVVWGMFGCSRGKFKGFLANNANTQRVNYTSDCGTHIVKYNPPFGDFDETDPIPPMNWPSTDHLSELVKAAIQQQKKGK